MDCLCSFHNGMPAYLHLDVRKAHQYFSLLGLLATAGQELSYPCALSVVNVFLYLDYDFIGDFQRKRGCHTPPRVFILHAIIPTAEHAT